jgi:predicted AlkP superfamily phosphohydrolase/phosphomutase
MLSGMGVPDLRGGQGIFSFYTSVSTDETRPQGGLVVVVPEETKIRTRLIGPRGPKGEDVSIPLEIVLDPNDRSVEISVSGTRFRLKERSWSRWIRVRFPIDIFTGVRAMCRFYLKSASHPFELYCSPMNFDPRQPAFPISYKDDYARKLQEAIGDFHTMGMPHDTWALNEGRMDEEMFLSQTDTIIAEERAMVLHELKQFESGLLMVVFESLDRLQHMFWRYVDQESPLYDKEGAQRYGGVIEQYYEGMDRILGEIFEFVDDKIVLLISSDHGFTHFRRAVHINSWLRESGFLKLRPGCKEGRALFRDVDWAATRAYAVGLGSLYINLKGRESQGIVMPGSEKYRVESEIVQGLEALTDPQGGGRIVYKVYRRDEIFSGSRLERMPDLVVAFVPGYRVSWQTALGAAPPVVTEDNQKKWSGDHIVDPLFVPGVFFSNKRLNVEGELSLYDIAPTILSIFGIEAPKNYLGRSLWRVASAKPVGSKG